MKVNVFDQGAVMMVTLSKRNLLTLLSKVDNPNSARTIYKVNGGVYVGVKAEPDDVHYGEQKPGKMDDAAEGFITAYNKIKEAP